MLSNDQKKQLFMLMTELPNYVSEQSAQSALANLVRADDSILENLYHVIFVKKDWPKDYKHPSVYIKRFFDHQ
mgnify:CR=1 FL=1|jgi:hypothetical protein